MGEVVIDLLPLLIGAAVLPAWIVFVLFLLRGERGVSKALAFLGGALLVRLIQGAVFGFVFERAGETYGEEGVNGIAATLLLIVGMLMLWVAVKTWRQEIDPDGPPPGWKERLRRAHPVKALGMGALLMLIGMKQWVFTLSAIAVIEQGALGRGASILVFLIFALGAQSLMLLPVMLTVLTPTRAEHWLAALEGWLARHERVIKITVSLLFGVWFTWQGITGLMG